MPYTAAMGKRFLETSLDLATLQSFPIQGFLLVMNATLGKQRNVFVG